MYYTWSIPQRLDTDVQSVVTAKTSQRWASDGANSDVIIALSLIVLG